MTHDDGETMPDTHPQAAADSGLHGYDQAVTTATDEAPARARSRAAAALQRMVHAAALTSSAKGARNQAIVEMRLAGMRPPEIARFLAYLTEQVEIPESLLDEDIDFGVSESNVRLVLKLAKVR